MSHTPLSDKLSTLINSTDPSLKADLERCFLTAELGIILTGLPTVASTQSYTINSTDNVQSVLVGDPEGRPMVKACADPAVFEQNYPAGINALITGQEILEMLMQLPDVAGVLICSATSFNSYPIYRDRAQVLLAA
jgi:hypothetical protein